MAISIPASWAGMLGTQQWLNAPPINVELLFSLFSLAVGGIILWRTLREKKDSTSYTTTLTPKQKLQLMLVSLCGGVITAWLSIGVGEVLAIYLLFLGFPVNIAIASAVCVTSATVLTGIFHHIFGTQAINLDVLIFAAPGALIGGALARRFATWLGARLLKLMMAGWIIFSALTYWLI
jgi:uncharacterized membrane protein YfcA